MSLEEIKNIETQQSVYYDLPFGADSVDEAEQTDHFLASVNVETDGKMALN